MAPQTRRQKRMLEMEVAVPPPPKRSRTASAEQPQQASPPPPPPPQDVLGLIDMPYDVLLQILQELCPADLLSLARANKIMRATLLSKTARPIWRDALAQYSQNSHLPPCPAWLSEPGYVELAFGLDCHKCGRKQCSPGDTIWQFAARYCRKCFPSMVTNRDELQRKSSSRYTVLNKLLPVWRTEKHVYYVHTIDVQMLTAKESFLESTELSTELKDRKTNREDVGALEKWSKDSDLVYREKATLLRGRRIEAIVERLKVMGYERDVADLGEDYYVLQQFPPAGIPGELDDAEWEEIKPAIIELMKERQKIRHFCEKVELIQQTCLSVLERALSELGTADALKEPFPHPMDVARYEEVQNVLEGPGGMTAKLTALRRVLPKQIRAWKRGVQTALQERVGSAVKIPRVCSHSNHLRPLHMQPAKLVFKCLDCDCLRHWPAVTAHSHPTAENERHQRRPSEHMRKLHGELPTITGSAYTAAVYGRYDRGQWSADDFIYCGRRAVNVFRACLQDPNNVTIGDMDALNVRFSCALCHAKSPRTKMIWSWRDAIHHCADEHDEMNGARLTWNLVNLEETAIVKKKQAARNRQSRMEYSDAEPWMCTHCYREMKDGILMTKEVAARHVKRVHGVQKLGAEDIVINPDRTPYWPRAVELIDDGLTRWEVEEIESEEKIADKLAALIPRHLSPSWNWPPPHRRY
ncbi:uncharacterized protein LAESUDRAFT_809922 [Laetiporus sulphureus 93-53]|uniref:F-box domain-containing protein n=1 Tax=Laetiporus sulphureus 93-53 TaxID=1314785 RepID=A0A165GDQ4_9APHY|nr:uncharacterized protein LAESUDRAFT_809922 [Laetiporus sulphureus 93-53]KZT10205.1 hypothetical protein LAESUDRAFT_809922 [Laetiporus sulphureus 93-53]